MYQHVKRHVAISYSSKFKFGISNKLGTTRHVFYFQNARENSENLKSIIFDDVEATAFGKII